ncbi:hypothetical protein CXU09_02845 [Akkermansia muciniphila]|uniref:Uncharacterized protein n=1 Tax=Akkermansia muciniphila TaxID=239935 RepID=A0AAP8TAF7_9BACT|nr:hypothetical protein CXU09_02845 [Akkermansia muciniphila]
MPCTGRFSKSVKARRGFSGGGENEERKKVPPFFPNTVPAPEAELLGAPGSSPVLQEADGCRFTQIPYGRKTASFFCPNHRRIPRRRIAACVFYLVSTLSPRLRRNIRNRSRRNLPWCRKAPSGKLPNSRKHGKTFPRQPQEPVFRSHAATKLFCRETEDTGIKTENVPDS